MVYRSKYDEESLNSVEVIKDTVGAFWVKEEFDGNVINYLISRETGELLDIKGYDEEGRFNHPQMLSNSEKQVVLQKRIEKKETLQSKNIYSLCNERRNFNLMNRNYSCKLVSNSFSGESEILVSEEIPRMLPFSFGLELELSFDVYSDVNYGLVSSGFIELLEIREGEQNDED